MNYSFVIIILCVFLYGNISSSADTSESISLLKGNSTSEKKVWSIKLDIYFSKTLPSVVTKPLGNDVRLKCEAIMNFTRVEQHTKNKEGIETSLKDSLPDYIQQEILKNVKVYWLKDNKLVQESQRVTVTTKFDKINGTIGTNLKVKNIEHSDNGNYTCVIKQNFEKKQTTHLKVVEDIENYDIPTYTSLFTNADNELQVSVKTTPHLGKEEIRSQSMDTPLQENTELPHKLEPICQEYVGNVCAMHLQGQFVYIPYNTTQAALEDKLMNAIRVTEYSNDISSQCEGYARPSLCYSTFPICRDPLLINDNFFKEARQIFSVTEIPNTNENEDLPQIVFENLPDGALPYLYIKGNRNFTADLFNYRYNSSVLRRVCKQDCEILENELCQTEYAIAKRHPHIGQQLTLEECQDLPEDDPDCLKIGIGTVMVSDDECYWEDGSGYLGRVNVAINGKPCIEWSKQLHARVSDYPELAGRHSYCRNPGGLKLQPWCVVDKDGKTDQQLCDIPKCAPKKSSVLLVNSFLLKKTMMMYNLRQRKVHQNPPLKPKSSQDPKIKIKLRQ